MNPRLKEILPFFVLLSVIGAVMLLIARWGDDSQPLVAGTIVTREVAVTLETGGQVLAVQAAEGQAVKAGEVLLRLDDTQLRAEYNRAAAGLARAEASYGFLASQPLSEQRVAAIRQAEVEVLEAELALQSVHDLADQRRAEAQKKLVEGEQALEDLLDPSRQQAQAREKIAAADKAWDSANRQVSILTTPATQAAIDQAYANLLLAENTLNQTLEDLDWAQAKLQGNLGPEIPKEVYIEQYKAEFRQTVQALEFKLAQDQLAYDRALENYQTLFEPPDPVELALAEAALALAEAEREQAEREYQRALEGPSQADIAILEARIEAEKREVESFQDGPDPDDLALAEARVRQAEAGLALAKADTIEEELAVARAQVATAQAALDIIQAQLEQLVVTAPVDGTVLERKVEAGEVVKPGTTVFTLALLNQLSITFYLPEDLYPKIASEEVYPIQVDGFPDLLFNARVVKKASREAFIPRNTRSGSSIEAVFAVQMVIEDSPGRLRPGMLAHLEMGLIGNQK